MANRTIRFRQAQLIHAVGATPIKTQRGIFFKLGGGIFTKRQILGSRGRMARMQAPSRPTNRQLLSSLMQTHRRKKYGLW